MESFISNHLYLQTTDAAVELTNKSFNAIDKKELYNNIFLLGIIHRMGEEGRKKAMYYPMLRFKYYNK